MQNLYKPLWRRVDRHFLGTALQRHSQQLISGPKGIPKNQDAALSSGLRVCPGGIKRGH